jgi:hypothetical protein
VTAPRTRSGRVRSTAADSRGALLVEVLLAAGILLVVMVPALYLMGVSASNLGVSKIRNGADQVAESQLEQIANQAVTSFPPKGATSASLTKTWATSGVGATAVISGVTYHAYEAGGWCGLKKTAAYEYSWTSVTYNSSYAYGVPEYFVAVKVVWGPNSATSTTNTKKYTMIQSRSIADPTYKTVPSSSGSGTSLATCPLGKTTHE